MPELSQRILQRSQEVHLSALERLKGKLMSFTTQDEPDPFASSKILSPGYARQQNEIAEHVGGEKPYLSGDAQIVTAPEDLEPALTVAEQTLTEEQAAVDPTNPVTVEAQQIAEHERAMEDLNHTRDVLTRLLHIPVSNNFRTETNTQVPDAAVPVEPSPDSKKHKARVFLQGVFQGIKGKRNTLGSAICNMAWVDADGNLKTSDSSTLLNQGPTSIDLAQVPIRLPVSEPISLPTPPTPLLPDPNLLQNTLESIPGKTTVELQIEKYEQARLEFQKWARENTTPGKDLYRHIHCLRDLEGADGKKLFEFGHIPTLAATPATGEINPAATTKYFIRNNLAYIKRLDDLMIRPDITDKQYNEIRSLRYILLEKVSNLTGGAIVTEDKTRDIFSNIVSGETLQEWKNRGFNIEYKGTQPQNPKRFKIIQYGFYPADASVRSKLAIPYLVEYLSEDDERAYDEVEGKFKGLQDKMVGILEDGKIDIEQILPGKRERDRYTENKEIIKEALAVESIRRLTLESLYLGHSKDLYESILSSYLQGPAYFDIVRRLGLSNDHNDIKSIDLALMQAYDVFSNQLGLGYTDRFNEDNREEIATTFGWEHKPLGASPLYLKHQKHTADEEESGARIQSIQEFKKKLENPTRGDPADAELLSVQEIDEIRTHTYQIMLSGKLGRNDYLCDQNQRHSIGGEFMDISESLQSKQYRIYDSGRSGDFLLNFGYPAAINNALVHNNYFLFEPHQIDFNDAKKEYITDPDRTVLRYFFFRDGKTLVDAHRLNDFVDGEVFQTNLLSVLLDTDEAKKLEKRIKANPENARAYFSQIVPGLKSMSTLPAYGLMELPVENRKDFLHSLTPDETSRFARPFSNMTQPTQSTPATQIQPMQTDRQT